MATEAHINLGRKTLSQIITFLESTHTDSQIRQVLFRHGLDGRYQGGNKLSRLGNVFYPIIKGGDGEEMARAVDVAVEIIQGLFRSIKETGNQIQRESAQRDYEAFKIAIGQDGLGLSDGSIIPCSDVSLATPAAPLKTRANGQSLRQRILQFLLEEEHRSSGLANLATITQAMGEPESEVSDQIDILESLGAVNANRTFGDVAPMLTGTGKLMIEEGNQETPSSIIYPEYMVTPAKPRPTSAMEWDIFICHASEDKDDFVRPLAQKLQGLGQKVWYDEFTLTVGDRLRRKIDEGLAKSAYGVVVLSKNFFRKDWPQAELDGLASRERDDRKVILPVWKDVDREFVVSKSPLLSGRLAARASGGLDKVAQELLRGMGVIHSM